ncbi:MAG: hypothetical protein IJ391_08070 [Clostridia bacterium]|nr:hypothetical protein [Clostridia bacterium]
MTNKNNTKRALFLSAVSMLLCFVMLAGSTYAWFTDTVEVKKSRIVAGVLDVELEYTNDAVSGEWKNVEEIDDTLEYAPFFLDNEGNQILWEPGVVAYANFKVVNAGNRALEYSFSTIAAAYNTVSDSEANLTDVIKVGVLELDTAEPALYEDRAELIELVEASEIGWADFTLESQTGKLLEENEVDYFTMVLYWEPSTADNDYNLKDGKTSSDGEPLYVDADIKLVATQVEYEKDAIDENYDAMASNPVIIKTAEDLEAALETATPGSTLSLTGTDYGTVELIGNLTDVTIAADPATVVEYDIKSTAVLENVTLSGINVTYSKTSEAYVDGGLIEIDAGASVTNLVIENATFNGSGGRSSAISCSEPSAEITLKSSTINGPKYGIYASAPMAAVTIENCTINNVSSWVALFNGNDANGTTLTITGNTFDNCTGGIAKYLGSLPANTSVTFKNNTLTDSTGHDGSSAKWFTLPGAATVTVSGNTLDGTAWTPGTAEGLGA